MNKALLKPTVDELRNQYKGDKQRDAYFQVLDLLKPFTEEFKASELHATRLERFLAICYELRLDLEDVRHTKKPVDFIDSIMSNLYKGVTVPMENWWEESRRTAHRLRTTQPVATLLQVPEPQDTKTDVFECVVDEFVGDDAVVIVMVDEKPEKRLMSRSQLTRAGIVREGQPFNIDVEERVGFDGLESNRRIRPTGSPSKWMSRPIRPVQDE